MASVTIPVRGETHNHLRPLSVLRDLPAVADLIEVCFSSTMDSEGRRYVQDMRRAGRDNSFLQWASRAVESTSLPLTGYVWEEEGRVVGNSSLVPFRSGNRRVYLVANIAVHPDYRRRGIARALTERAMQHARERQVNDIWLHVRDDNPGAVDLYAKLGFVERARRTSWQAYTDPNAVMQFPDVAVGARDPADWPVQQEWLERSYPGQLSWHRNWSFNQLRPGLVNWLYLLFVDMNVRQWAAYRNGRFEAALAWLPNGRGESLYAAAGQGSAPEALTSLLLKARRDLASQQHTIALEFPAGSLDHAIFTAGFSRLRTLIWMQAT